MHIPSNAPPQLPAALSHMHCHWLEDENQSKKQNTEEDLADNSLRDTMWIPPCCLFLICRTEVWLYSQGIWENDDVSALKCMRVSVEVDTHTLHFRLCELLVLHLVHLFICSDGAVTETLVQFPDTLWSTSHVLYAPLFFVHFVFICPVLSNID